MKVLLFPVVIGGFVLVLLFQGIQFASFSSSQQATQKKIDQLEEKIDLLQKSIDNDVVAKITSLKQTKSITDTNTDLTGLLSPENVAYTLGVQTTATPSAIALKSAWNKTDVYEQSKASSKIVGEIQKGQTYQVLEKLADWYKIQLNSKNTGWVSVQFVNETI
jgi:hypothetical protein